MRRYLASMHRLGRSALRLMTLLDLAILVPSGFFVLLGATILLGEALDAITDWLDQL